MLQKAWLGLTIVVVLAISIGVFSDLSGCDDNGQAQPAWQQPTIEYRVEVDTAPAYLGLTESALRELVQWAFRRWQEIVPGAPIALESANADSVIRFAVLQNNAFGVTHTGPWSAGFPTEIKWFTITLNNQDKLFSLQRESTRIHLPTLLLHEVGHVFLGPGHLADPDQVMFGYFAPGEVRVAFGTCDLALMGRYK